MLLQLLLLAAVNGLQAQQLPVSDSAVKINSNLQPAEMLKNLQIQSAVFSTLEDNRADFGLTGTEYRYLLIKLSSAEVVKDQVISIDNTSLDSIMIYQVFAAGKAKLLYQGGELMAYKNNQYNWHTANVETGPAPVYYLVAAKAIHRNINFRYEILSKDALREKYATYTNYVVAYSSIIAMILAVVVIAFFLFKRNEFALYAGYIICFSSWVLAHYGRLFPALYPDVPFINLAVKPVASLGACFFLIAVLRLVFLKQLRQQHVRLFKFTTVILYCLGSLIASMLLFLLPHLNGWLNKALVVAWHAGLLVSIGVAVYLPVVFIHSGKTAKIFLAAVLVVALFASMQIFATLGYINSFFLNEHGMTMGSLLEITIMAFGLFYSLLEQMKQKEKHLLALEQEQTETLKKLVTVQDHERKRIAADLHDNIGPLLAALKINFGRIVHTKDPALLNGTIGKTEAIIDDSIAEIRNVAHNLMPKGLSSNGLISTLNEYLESIQQLYNKEVQFNKQVEAALSIELQTNLYRIICELVLNAARHSKASKITVTLAANQQMVAVYIADNGQGFYHHNGGETNSFGLQSAEGRVQYLKGKFVLQSEKAVGTWINIEIPLQPDEVKVNSF